MITINAANEMYSNAFMMRTNIVNAVGRMCQSQQFSNISVSQICKEANISRQTFYRYFPSKQAIAGWYVAQLTISAFRKINDSYSWQQAIYEALALCHDAPEEFLVDALDMPHYTEFVRSEAEGISEGMLGILRMREIKLTQQLIEEIDVFSYAFVATCMEYGRMEKWKTIDPTRMSELISQLVPQRIRIAFGEAPTMGYRLIPDTNNGVM